ncbi:MAG TPA: MarR family winged helix-turn-helix transcriptional regulator [Solirubrobacteraceae bacterium]|nr:MarR family winged helix-turn-helix transcriptional regulator [Solirubrobacteraceae bacterium]
MSKSRRDEAGREQARSEESRREDFVALLYNAADGLVAELLRRMDQAGYGDVRQTHGCVFGNIAADGMRLTELAELANMTKQGVGEAVSDLERMGYAERVADPSDGRAKIIRLTERGRAAQRAGFEIIAGIERDWVKRFGAERVRELRSLLLDLTEPELDLARAA